MSKFLNTSKTLHPTMCPVNGFKARSNPVGVVDTKYWNTFYGNHNHVLSPSLFAEYCQKEHFFNRSLNVLEVGCGNGRDAVFFATHHHNVTAVDRAEVVIQDNHNRTVQQGVPVNFEVADFVQYVKSANAGFDVVYSRFSLHAVGAEEQQVFLRDCIKALVPGGLLLIEVRTVYDELFGVGKALGDNAFYSDHYRRFIEPNAFIEGAIGMGWEVKYHVVSRGLAPYGDEDPKVMRIVLQNG